MIPVETIEKLRRQPLEHAWAIQDLMLWPESSRIFTAESSRGISYLLITGHPSQRGETTTVILGDDGGVIESLLPHLPEGPLVIRETNAAILPKIKPYLLGAKIELQQRMDVTRSTFRPPSAIHARRLTEFDAPALATFYGAPVQAAERMVNWIKGAVVMARFEGNLIAALGSTMVRIPDVWMFVEIITKSEFRGRGFGTDVTAALTAAALEESPTASLTVMKENAPAIRVYEKLGYEAREDRIWVTRA